MVREVRIYVEGGGEKKDSKGAMQRGFGQFLRDLRALARAQRIGWSVIACGARSATIDAFCIAQRARPEAFSVLLVDAEGPVSMKPRVHVFEGHPRRREVQDEQCHLMVQMMEAWLVADVGALEGFYGSGFRASAVPARHDVEAIDKADLEAALHNATRDTQKGVYHKTRHAPRILERLDTGIVRRKAPHCERLFRTLRSAIEG